MTIAAPSSRSAGMPGTRRRRSSTTRRTSLVGVPTGSPYRIHPPSTRRASRPLLVNRVSAVETLGRRAPMRQPQRNLHAGVADVPPTLCEVPEEREGAAVDPGELGDRVNHPDAMRAFDGPGHER